MKRYSERERIESILFFFLLLITTVGIILNLDQVRSNYTVFFTFVINGTLIFFGIMRNSKLGFSISEMFYIFMFLFMFLAPIAQYSFNIFPWWNAYVITDDVIIKTNLIITVFLLVYKFSYNLKTKGISSANIINSEILNLNVVINLGVILSFICASYVISKTGFNNLFARATNGLDIDSSAWSLVVTNTFTAVPVIVFAIYTLAIQKKYKKISFAYFLVGLVMILINFPTGAARFKMAVVYIGLFIILVDRLKSKYVFKCLILFGMFYVFPIMGLFRHNTFEDLITLGRVVTINPAMELLTGNFDSFSMLARIIVYVGNQGIVFGQQLLGNILFFIPRIFWQNKPIGTGVFIAESYGWGFTNVSAPYIGEGYINFGIIGAVIFALGFGIISKKLDKHYETLKAVETKRINYIEVGYPFILGFVFFILRGDLLSSISYLIGFLIPLAILGMMDKFVSLLIKVKLEE